MKAYNAAWRKANPQKGRSANAAWKKSHPREVKAYGKAWRKANFENVKISEAAYRKANHKKYLAWYAAYGRTIEGRYGHLSYRHKKQLVPLGCKGRFISLMEYQNKLYFKNGKGRPCFYCLGENNKTGSGLDRLDNSVTYTVKNTVVACRGCNVWRGNNHTVQETLQHFKPMRDAARRRKK